MRKSRRRFLRLAATGAAALALVPEATVAEAAKRVKPAGRPAPRPVPAGPSPAVAAEIRKQKDYVAHSLEALRAFPLANGDEPASVFTPLKARRAKGR